MTLKRRLAKLRCVWHYRWLDLVEYWQVRVALWRARNGASPEGSSNGYGCELLDRGLLAPQPCDCMICVVERSEKEGA